MVSKMANAMVDLMECELVEQWADEKAEKMVAK